MPIRSKSWPERPPRFGADEVEAITAALNKNQLWYWQDDSAVDRATKEAASKFNAKYAVATSSGTASLHVAVAASLLKPGTEIITTPITDIGTINAILYQNLIPVFADVDPDSSLLTVDTIKKVATDRTGAVLVVHLSGCPVEISEIAGFCASNGLILIEDCAQALGARYRGQYLGTFGDFGCYSLNDQKHITSGEGGFIIINDEERFFLCHNYADKYYDRHRRGVRLSALAPNYRMSEIDGAMFSVQLRKLDGIARRRRTLGDALSKELAQISGIIPQKQPNDAEASYFFYLLRIDPQKIRLTRDEFLAALKRELGEKVPARGAYVSEPIYRSPYFQNKSFFPGGIWPAEIVAGRSYDYQNINLPGAELAVGTGITLSLHEGYTENDIYDYVNAIKNIVSRSS